MFMMFLGSIGLFLKIWFWVVTAISFAEVLSEEEVEEAPPDSAIQYIAGRIFVWVKAVVIYFVQAFLSLGSLIGLLAFVGYNELWALGVTVLTGAILYALIEFHQKRAVAYE